MTEEELIKEATSTTAWRCITMIDRPLFVRGYIMGAEPREKRIVELEKENANLNANLKVLRKYELNIAKLEIEKENTELKEHHKIVCENLTNTHRNIRNQLTQAKELLKKIEKIVYSGENEIKRLSKIVDILAEAEQFLKEK